MELALPNIKLVFEVTFDSPDLDVGMSVYDTSGSSPVLVSGPTAMMNVVGNTYYGSFIGVNNKSYVIYKAVYTDNTFETLDGNYSQGTESIVVETPGGGGGGSSSSCEVIGVIVPNNTLIGLIDC